jgi:5-methylcytosine-specific restriction endonuclease McrA
MYIGQPPNIHLMSDINPQHESVLDRQMVLMLNASWIAVGYLTVKKSLVALCGGDSNHHVMALDLTLDEWGNLLYANPVDFETWCQLPVREGDAYIQTHKGRIRAPTVVITKAFNKVPVKKPRVSARAIYDRDGGRCQYTGRPVSRSAATLDHVQPKSRGGRDSFENLVLCDKDVNMEKADRTPDEAGLKLLRKPFEPKALPVTATIAVNHIDWKPFLVRGA